MSSPSLCQQQNITIAKKNLGKLLSLKFLVIFDNIVKLLYALVTFSWYIAY
jgi:hypothetical protein